MSDHNSITQFVQKVVSGEWPVAILFGASGGVGRSCARMLTRRGFATVLTGRTEQTLKAEAAKLSGMGGPPSLPYALDLCDPSAIQTLAIELNPLNTVSVIILSAGITSNETTDMEFEEVQRVIATNLVSVMWCAKHFVPLLRRGSNSYVINIASRAGLIGFAGKGLYGASKAATIRFMDSLRSELEPDGIRVTSICPGWINTPMASAGGCLRDPEEILQPDDVTSIIEWLLASPARIVVRDITLEVAPPRASKGT